MGNVRGESNISLYSFCECFVFSTSIASGSIATSFIEIMIYLFYLALCFVLHAVSTPVVPISKSTFSVAEPSSAPTPESLKSVLLQQNYTETNGGSGEHQNLSTSLNAFHWPSYPFFYPREEDPYIRVAIYTQYWIVDQERESILHLVANVLHWTWTVFPRSSDFLMAENYAFTCGPLDHGVQHGLVLTVHNADAEIGLRHHSFSLSKTLSLLLSIFYNSEVGHPLGIQPFIMERQWRRLTLGYYNPQRASQYRMMTCKDRN